MAWIRGGLLVGAALATLSAVGCFSDTGAPAGESRSEGTGADCPAGSRTCACYGNGTCDESLVCVESIACFPGDCVAGTENCPCLSSGGCDVGLTCNGMACVPEGTSGTSGTSTTSMSSTSAGPSTTEPSTTDITESAGSTGALDCVIDDSDPMCFNCARQHCCTEYLECIADPACQAMLGCVTPGDPFGMCAQQNEFGGAAFVALAQCITDPAVPMACRQCGPPTLACLGPDLAEPIYARCTECAAIECCNRLQQCYEDPMCLCLEQCLATPDGAPTFDACIQGECSAFMNMLSMPYSNLSTCYGGTTCSAGSNCYPLPDPGPGSGAG